MKHSVWGLLALRVDGRSASIGAAREHVAMQAGGQATPAVYGADVPASAGGGAVGRRRGIDGSVRHTRLADTSFLSPRFDQFFVWFFRCCNHVFMVVVFLNL
jgi:hypothetical protein